MEEARYTLRNIQEKIDYGDVLNKAIDVAAKAKDKELVADLLKNYAQQDDELIAKAIEFSEKISNEALNFFERRYDAYLQGSKIQKVFGFKRWCDIERDSWNAAIAETKAVLDMISPFEQPAIKALIASRAQTEQILTCHLSNMLAEDSFKKLNLKGIKGILGQE